MSEERIGSYRVLRELGSGGQATVFLVEDGKTGVKAALKRLDASSKEQRIRFRREAQMLRKFEHPNVVRVLDASDDPPYYVMEYRQGESLEEVLKKGTVFSSERTLSLLCDVARGLAAIHDQGILHRDMKPANLILCPDGSAVITDFGIARDTQATSITKTGNIVGTPLYFSPEQIQRKRLDARSDLYQVGLIGYKMLTGNTPFEGDDVATLTTRRVHEDPLPLSTMAGDVNPHLERILLRLLSITPDRRYATAAALLEDLERLSRGEAPSAGHIRKRANALQPRPAVVLPLPREHRRARWMLLVALSLFAALGTFLLSSRPKGPALTRSATMDIRDLEFVEAPGGVRVSFRSLTPMTTRIEWGESRDLGRILRISTEASTTHEGLMEGVRGGRPTFYRLQGIDGAHRLVETETASFVPGRSGATALSNVSATFEGPFLHLRFETAQPCRSRLRYGRTRPLSSLATVSSTLSTRHDLRVPTPETGHWYWCVELETEAGRSFSTPIRGAER